MKQLIKTVIPTRKCHRKKIKEAPRIRCVQRSSFVTCRDKMRPTSWLLRVNKMYKYSTFFSSAGAHNEERP